MSELPSSEPSEQELQEAADTEYILRRWINSIHSAAEGICARTGLRVLIDYRKGILTPDVDAKNLTAEQREEIQRWQDGFPHLTIRFHR